MDAGSFIKDFSVRYIGGATLYLRADRLVTTTAGAILDPADISTANWALLNGTRTASRFTEASDTGQFHAVSQAAAATLLQTNHTTHVRVGLPFATGDGRYCLIACSSGGDVAFLDLQSRTVRATIGIVFNAIFNGDVFEADFGTSGAGNFYIGTDTGSGTSLTWNGNGLRYVQLGDIGNGNFAEVTQLNAQYWLDQTTTGNYLQQLTADKMPLVIRDPLFGNHWTLRSDGVNDIMDLNVDVTDSAFTLFCVCNKTAVQNDGNFKTWCRFNKWLLLARSDVTDQWGVYTGDGPHLSGATLGSTPNIITVRAHSATQIDLYTNTTLNITIDGNSYLNLASPQMFDNGAAQSVQGSISEVVYFSRVLTDAEVARTQAELLKRYFPHSFSDLATFEGDFDPDTLGVGAITSWLNSGTHGKSLTGTATVISNDVNGHKSVSFNGTSDVLDGGSNIIMSDLMTTQAVTVFCVCYIPSIGGADSATPYLNPAVMSGGAEYQGLHLRATGTKFQSYLWDGAAQNAEVTTATGRWVLLQQRLKSNLLYGRSEAGTEVSVACAGIADVSGSIRFGVNYTTEFQQCKIARVLVSKTALSDATITAVRARLASLYGVTV